jgi:homoserine O-acetyltransferase
MSSAAVSNLKALVVRQLRAVRLSQQCALAYRSLSALPFTPFQRQFSSTPVPNPNDSYKCRSGSWWPRAVHEVTLPQPHYPVLCHPTSSTEELHKAPGSRSQSPHCSSAVSISKVTLKVEEYGLHTLGPHRTIVIFPSFSRTSHVARNTSDPAPGWWEEMVGAGKPIDTRHWRIICISVLGSPTSPTNPTSINPETKQQYRTSFPQITPSDLAICHYNVLKELGITSEVHAVIGSSLGGMQALQFASLFPDMTKRLIGIACTGRTTPFTVGIRGMQRKAILSDPSYHKGNYADHQTGPYTGLAAAREMGTLFYRSRQEFDSRFKWEPFGDKHFTSKDTWEVESYLNYQGAKFVRTYDANAYLLLSKCMDLMDLGDGVAGRKTYAEGASRIKASSLLIGVKQDMLIPSQELSKLAETMNQNGGAATFMEMDSEYGHDAFLKEFDWLGPRIRQHLEGGLELELAGERDINTGLNAP